MREQFTATNIAYFWSKVVQTPECWGWTGPRRPEGYGLLHYGQGATRKTINANRFAYELLVGPVGDMCVLHHCDSPGCNRPEHLFRGTRRDNNADMDAKGRRRVAYGEANGSRKHPERLKRGCDHYLRLDPSRVEGERNFNVKLTADNVLEIRRLFASGGVTKAYLGRQFKVGEVTVGAIVRRETWKHI